MVSRRLQTIRVGCLVLAIILDKTNGGSIRGGGGELKQQNHNINNLYSDEQQHTTISSKLDQHQVDKGIEKENQQDVHEVTSYYDEITRRTVDTCLAASPNSYRKNSLKQPELTVIQYYFAVESTMANLHRRTIQKLETLLFHLISDKVMWCSLKDGGGGRRQRHLEQQQQLLQQDDDEELYLSDSMISKIRNHHGKCEMSLCCNPFLLLSIASILSHCSFFSLWALDFLAFSTTILGG